MPSPSLSQAPMHLIATCPEETKEVLIQELKDLGVQDIRPAYRAVHFTATERQFYEAHLWLRTASRVFKVIKEVPAQTPEILASQTSRINWSKYFDVKHSYMVAGVATDRGDEFMRSSEISEKVREGVANSFKHFVGEIPLVETENPRVIIIAYLSKGRCLFSFDTTGKALHLRGYRLDGHPAPIKETLAASLLKMAGYDGSQLLLDPMCGSGTFPIEAGTMVLREAPNIQRGRGQFLFEWQKDFNKDLWREVCDDARSKKLSALPAPIVASDISPQFVEMAKNHALRARVERYIDFRCAPFAELEPPTAPEGVKKLLITNLPYGERLESEKSRLDMEEFYRDIGNILKRRYAGWRAALLVMQDSPHKFIGLKPTRKIPVMNGSIECRLLIFDLYDGSRRASKAGPQV